MVENRWNSDLNEYVEHKETYNHGLRNAGVLLSAL